MRNRIKRRLRAAFRLHRAQIGPQWDIVLNPRRAALDASFADIEKAFARLIQKMPIDKISIEKMQIENKRIEKCGP